MRPLCPCRQGMNSSLLSPSTLSYNTVLAQILGLTSEYVTKPTKTENQEHLQGCGEMGTPVYAGNANWPAILGKNVLQTLKNRMPVRSSNPLPGCMSQRTEERAHSSVCAPNTGPHGRQVSSPDK